MAVVQGIREQIHGPVYDALKVPPGKQLREAEPTSTLRFFVNVQNKTKLETNLQSAALLPHYNTFEARAMRVVISDLPPEFPEKESSGSLTGVPVTKPDRDPNNEVEVKVNADGKVHSNSSENTELVKADIALGLGRIMKLRAEAREREEKSITLSVTEKGVKLKTADATITVDAQSVEEDQGIITLTVDDFEKMLDELDERKRPSKEQLSPNNGAGTLISKFIYNTVTTLYVGEKIMIQMPTWFFPAGAGPFSEAGHFTTHGQPDPMATFRFAEPVFIDKQQNFRVEIEVPDKDILEELHRLYGPLFIWVVLDGFMTRDVQ